MTVCLGWCLLVMHIHEPAACTLPECAQIFYTVIQFRACCAYRTLPSMPIHAGWLLCCLFRYHLHPTNPTRYPCAPGDHNWVYLLYGSCLCRLLPACCPTLGAQCWSCLNNTEYKGGGHQHQLHSPCACCISRSALLRSAVLRGWQRSY